MALQIDLDAAQEYIGGRLPDNRVLSHDLLEGGYARSGLVSDVLLVEDFPASHAAHVARRRVVRAGLLAICTRATRTAGRSRAWRGRP